MTRWATVGLAVTAVVLAVSLLSYESDCTVAAIAGTYDLKTSEHRYRLSLQQSGKGELLLLPSTKTSFSWELHPESGNIFLELDKTAQDIFYTIPTAKPEIVTQRYERIYFGLDPKCSVTGVNKIYINRDVDIYFLRLPKPE